MALGAYISYCGQQLPSKLHPKGLILEDPQHKAKKAIVWFCNDGCKSSLTALA